MKKRDQELKPCPFCGHLPRIRYTFGKPVIECENPKCKIRPSTWIHSDTNDFDKLIRIWNKRGYEEEDLCPHGYDYIMDCKFRKNLFGNDNLPEKWTILAPIVEWHNEDIWLYILRESLEFNPMYRKGFYRVGCLICPFQHDYIDLLIQEHYPKQWERWLGILKKNYELKEVESRLKWSFDEYKNSKWKTGMSKIQELIQLKPTKARVKEVARILGISDELAERYFQRKCGMCGKKLNPNEVAMFLKLYGRYEGIVDERKYLCKKCMCKELDITSKEYDTKVMEFRRDGCNLF